MKAISPDFVGLTIEEMKKTIGGARRHQEQPIVGGDDHSSLLDQHNGFASPLPPLVDHSIDSGNTNRRARRDSIQGGRFG